MAELPAKRRSDSTEQKVGISEIVVVAGTGVLKTLLGSCIGLVLDDRQHRVGGLAHIVLPMSEESGHLPGKYANTAVPELIRLIEKSGGSVRQLTAKLAGGANMFASSKTNRIGDQNLAMVESLLKKAGIPVVGVDCGGLQGRRMAYDVETGKVMVEIVGNPPTEL
jgi:chemotaxis protein CheD